MKYKNKFSELDLSSFLEARIWHKVSLVIFNWDKCYKMKEEQ